MKEALLRKIVFFFQHPHTFLSHILDRVAGHIVSCRYINLLTHTYISKLFFFAFHFVKNLHTRTGKSLSLAIKTQIKMYMYDKRMYIETKYTNIQLWMSYIRIWWIIYNFSFRGEMGSVGRLFFSPVSGMSWWYER